MAARYVTQAGLRPKAAHLPWLSWCWWARKLIDLCETLAPLLSAHIQVQWPPSLLSFPLILSGTCFWTAAFQ